MQQNKKKKSIYFAWILIFLSINILGFGFILDLDNNKKLINPVTDVEPSDEEGSISITTVDGNEVVPGNEIKNTKDKSKDKNDKVDVLDKADKNNDKSSKNEDNLVSPPVGSNVVTDNNTSIGADGSSDSGGIHIPTIDEANDSLRRSLQSTYGITIKYGEATTGYKVGGFSTTSVFNSTTINAALNRLKSSLALFPKGFFYEIKNGGIPLTIFFVNNYSDETITGITDSSYDYADISIALIHPFEDSFYHEMYHYIERFMFKKGANFNSWNSLNPMDFKYGTIVNDYSYQNTFSQFAYFVNNYAQTSETEDRASTFEFMMADSQASCLNQGGVVWQKANLIKNTIETVFNSVSPSVVEYWERFV